MGKCPTIPPTDTIAESEIQNQISITAEESIGPNIKCLDSQRGVAACYMLYEPVCAWVNYNFSIFTKY